MKKVNRDGQKFGLWTVIKRISGKTVLARCECGTEKTVNIDNLISGKSTSCGCLARELNKNRMSTHGESKTKLYGVWLTMRRRCDLKTTKSYANYGGRGIKVCDDWNNSFESFREWAMGNGYTDGLTLDRVDNNLHYTPENCRWVDRTIQGNNKRNNKLITINGVTHTSAEWSKISKLNRGTIESRIKRGWSGEKLLLPSQLGNNQFTNFEEV